MPAMTERWRCHREHVCAATVRLVADATLLPPGLSAPAQNADPTQSVPPSCVASRASLRRQRCRTVAVRWAHIDTGNVLACIRDGEFDIDAYFFNDMRFAPAPGVWRDKVDGRDCSYPGPPLRGRADPADVGVLPALVGPLSPVDGREGAACGLAASGGHLKDTQAGRDCMNPLLGRPAPPRRAAHAGGRKLRVQVGHLSLGGDRVDPPVGAAPSCGPHAGAQAGRDCRNPLRGFGDLAEEGGMHVQHCNEVLDSLAGRAPEQSHDHDCSVPSMPDAVVPGTQLEDVLETSRSGEEDTESGSSFGALADSSSFLCPLDLARLSCVSRAQRDIASRIVQDVQRHWLSLEGSDQAMTEGLDQCGGAAGLSCRGCGPR